MHRALFWAEWLKGGELSNFLRDLSVDDVFRLPLIFLIRSISLLSLRLVQFVRARCTNVDIRLILRLRGIKDSQSKYCWVKVGFRPTLVSSISSYTQQVRL